MNIEKLVEIELLYSQYSLLLTPKQRDIVSMHYKEDYSLGEISQILNISRQSVYDSLKKSEASLKEYEEKLKIVERLQKIDDIANKATDLIDNSLSKNKSSELIQLKKLIEEVRELI